MHCQCIFPTGRWFSDDFAIQQSVHIRDQSILIPGGTGSFGKAFVNSVLDHYPKIKRLVVYSHDLNKAKTGVLPITAMGMTRFNIPLEEGVEMVYWALEHALGGEILVPKIPSYRIGDVAEAVAPNCKQEIVGIRPGEKLHEEMITSSDSPSSMVLSGYYAILGVGVKTKLQST